MPQIGDVSQGRSIEELTTPRPIMMPPPDVFDADLAAIENSVRASVPEVIRKRLSTCRDLLVYGGFCYEFIAVSVLWSLTCIEMALWEKFTELNPGPLAVEDRKGTKETITTKELASRLQGRFRLVGMPKVNGSFRSLVDWAAEQRLVQDPEMLRGMVKLRNSFAHPKEFNFALNAAMAVPVFERTVEIVNHLWPLETL